MPDLQCRCLSSEPRVLRRAPEHRKRKHLGVSSDRRMSLNHHMRMQAYTIAENNIGANRAEWTNPDVLAQVCGVIDDGCRVNGNGH